MFAPADYLDLAQTQFPAVFDGVDRVWEVLARLPQFIAAQLKPAQHGTVIGTPYIGPDVFIGEGTVIEHGAVVLGPAIIGRGCAIRAGAYVRHHVIVGDGCVLGNACEFKNALLFNGVEVPHFSYVGDSVLGHQAHLGAGVILSNLKSVQGHVTVPCDGRQLDTGLRKFGAIVGDHAEVGCNCVLAPGSIIGRETILYPNLLWRGVCPARRIVKLRQEQAVIERR